MFPININIDTEKDFKNPLPKNGKWAQRASSIYEADQIIRTFLKHLLIHMKR